MSVLCSEIVIGQRHDGEGSSTLYRRSIAKAAPTAPSALITYSRIYN